MASFFDWFSSLLLIVAPQPCFDKYVKEYDFFDGECMKVVISKCLGLAIIAGAVLVKVPQIVKIMKAKKGEGISLVAVTLELLAVTSSFVYGYQKKFPFSSYGEGLFLVMQTLVIALLVLHYGDRQGALMAYLSVYVAMLAYLMSSMAPMSLVSALQAAVMPNLVVGRSIQIYANYSSGSTGQLSAITVFLLFIGAITRVFTSIQETGDSLMVLTYIVSASCNGVILFQIWYYGGVKKDEQKKTQ